MGIRKSVKVDIQLALSLLIFLVVSTSAFAQLPTATISGVVKDASGAVIPGASITATSPETGMSRTTKSASDGAYRFPAMPVGEYQVRAEQSGFQSKVQSGLRITVGQEAVLNFSLDVGSVSETVSVTAEAPLVNTTSGSLGGLVSEDRVSDLPLDGRNFNDLTLLQTGVSESKGANNGGTLNGTQFSSNGAPTRSNLFMIDGTIMNDAHGTGAASSNENSLGVEGIREYRVVTNSFSAEYGLTMGSQVSIVTKSGTNQFHGSLLEYLRNSALDARNWTDTSQKPSFRRNNFGGSFGGPIRRDKAFYFFTYEGLRQSRGTTVIYTVPTLAALQDGGLVPTIAASVKPYLKFFPAPNGEVIGQGIQRYYHPATEVQSENYYQGRVDYNLFANDTLFGRYTLSDSGDTQPGELEGVYSTFPTRNQYLTIADNHVFSGALLSTFRASFSRTHSTAVSENNLPPELAFTPGLPMGLLGITGISNYSASPQQTPVELNQRIFSLSDDMYYTRGKHSFKFGTLVNMYRQYLYNAGGGGGIRGAWTFTSLSQFLQAQPTQFQIYTPGSRFFRTYDYNTLGFYFQDDLRLTPTFTLNLGLRYEFATQANEIRGNGAALRDIQHDAAVTAGIPYINPSKRNISPRFGFAWDVNGEGKTSVRGGFGLLYDVGIFGTALFIGSSATPPLSSSSIVTPANGLTFGPFPSIPASAAGRDLRTLDFNMQQPHLLSYNLTVERQLPYQMGLTLAYAGSRGINIAQNKEGNPTVARGTPGVVNGVKTCQNISPAPAFVADGPKCWLGTEPRTNPAWGTIDYRTASGNSWYNSLQVGLQKRITRGLQFQSSYTWSHALDETQGQIAVDNNVGGVVGDDPSNRRSDKASADFDVRHSWHFNAIYRLPSRMTGTKGVLLNGWWTSGIINWQSGNPFGLTMATQRSRNGYAGPNGGAKRPDLRHGVDMNNVTRGTSAGCPGVAAGTKLGTPQMFYDPCAFSVPALGFIGNSGRNIIYGPNFSSVNFSFVKDTPLRKLGENGSLQFRTEIFNVLNHPSLGISAAMRTVFPGRTADEAPQTGASLINTVLSKSREIQFALKVIF